MFTGLIEEIGEVKAISNSGKAIRLTIAANKVLENVKLGDSIATNGVCLTVVNFSNNEFSADVMPETVNRSNLAILKKSSKVNLERALRLGDRLGGHMVSGHIDGTGVLEKREQDDNAIWVSISAPQQILKYIVEKGSIAIDGISLTVAYVDEKIFKVSIIPLTQDDTTLCGKNIGTKLNLECDMTAKYIEKFLSHQEVKEEPKSSIDMEFLKNNGYL
ncbi:MAG: riboflavin synthase [Marinifilaceae bacterium]|jgi:riboflavin synthase|nr:riboflavin synthase [Marinifilaceae bacterium]